jgi:hypothetical protein
MALQDTRVKAKRPAGIVISLFIYMDRFHIVVLSIAVILLIILLTFIGILMGNQKKGQTFPPEQYNCPDYWQVYTDSSTSSTTPVSAIASAKCIIPTAKSKLNCGKIYDGGNTLIANITSNPAITHGFNSVKQADGSIVNYINFNDPGWSGGICDKRTWARDHEIQWDGVSNYNSC